MNKQDKHVLIRLYYTLVRASRQIPCIFSDFLHTIYFLAFSFSFELWFSVGANAGF